MNIEKHPFRTHGVLPLSTNGEWFGNEVGDRRGGDFYSSLPLFERIICIHWLFA